MGGGRVEEREYNDRGNGKNLDRIGRERERERNITSVQPLEVD
jgi:hypothetical protein